MPRQDRARATVDAILDATAQVLVKAGYEGTSTNRVAQVAGVSVGSLYQYFPNKEALVAAVIDRHCEEMGSMIESKVAELYDAPLPVATRELVTLLLEAHKLDPKLHQVLLEQVPRVGKLGRMRQLMERVALILTQYLEPRRNELRPGNLELAIFLIVTGVEAINHAVISQRGARIQPEVVDEICALVLRYLLPDERLAQLARATPERRPVAARA